jgi:hypothetical protein
MRVSVIGKGIQKLSANDFLPSPYPLPQGERVNILK